MLTPLATFFSARDCTVPQIGLLQPADPFLDTAGEDLRRRIYLTQGPRGENLCLRPEFTIPVCLLHLSGEGAPARYGYEGTVFRQRQDEPTEFRQAGIEDIGEPAIAKADARSLADALAMLKAISPGARFEVTLGDQSIFEAVIRALGLPNGWRRKLARSFGSPHKVEALLASLGAPRERPNDLAPEIATALEHADAAALSDAIAAQMQANGYLAAASRTPAEIAARMLEQAALDNARLTQGHINELRDFLSIRMPLDRAGEGLVQFARRLDGGMEAVLEAFTTRVDEIRAHGVDPSVVTYDAAFGRSLDYYTGLVYEITVPGLTKPVAGGGRYDKLLALLGAPAPVPAVGFSIWLDRMEQVQ